MVRARLWFKVSRITSSFFSVMIKLIGMSVNPLQLRGCPSPSTNLKTCGFNGFLLGSSYAFPFPLLEITWDLRFQQLEKGYTSSLQDFASLLTFMLASNQIGSAVRYWRLVNRHRLCFMGICPNFRLIPYWMVALGRPHLIWWVEKSILVFYIMVTWTLRTVCHSHLVVS